MLEAYSLDSGLGLLPFAACRVGALKRNRVLKVQLQAYEHGPDLFPHLEKPSTPNERPQHPEAVSR